MIRLFLLVDDEDLIEGLTYTLKKTQFELDVARTVHSARRLLADQKNTAGCSLPKPYELLLLDVSLPDGTGFEICEELRKTGNLTPIIFLTAADEETSIIRGLDSGGDDYITKPFRIGELCSRIRALLRRSSHFSHSNPDLQLYAPLTIDLLASKSTLYGVPLELTGAEYRLLCLLVKNSGRILARSTILDVLWDGNGSFIDDNTLSVYIRRLREKLEQDPSHPEHLITVRGFGYQWKEAES